MAILTSLQITNLYDSYKDIDITFNKDIIKASGLKTNEIFIKSAGTQRPCIIYSTSFTKARIIANTGNDFITKTREAGDFITLRMAFEDPDKKDLISFFINAKVTGYGVYDTPESSLNYINVTFTQRPPDDLIVIMGNLLQANVNFNKRVDERIIVNQNNFSDLGFSSREIKLVLQEIPRKSLLLDISNSGIKVIGVKAFKFHLNKDIIIKIPLKNKSEIEIPGTILRFDAIPNRNDLGIFGIKFKENSVPLSFKLQIEQYFESIKKNT
jgi:PilZN3 domain/PilZ domain